MELRSGKTIAASRTVFRQLRLRFMGTFGNISTETRECAFPESPNDGGGSIVFVNYDEARAYKYFVADMIVFILGADTRSDGGEGVFYFNSTSTDADDGGTVLRPDNIAVGDPGRLIRMVL